MAQAQAAGALSEFNREYRIRRLAAVERGTKFMPYTLARSRLARELGKLAAGADVEGVTARVFSEGKG
jgi:hypothetical protein